MEEKLLGKFKSGIIFGRLLVYSDRVEIKGLVSKKIIPASKIASVSVNKLFSRLSIETAGGGKTLIGGLRRKKLEEAANLITSIGEIDNASLKKISIDETKEKDTSNQQKVPDQKGIEIQNENVNILKKPWASMTKKEKLSVVGSIIVLLWFVGIFAVIISLFSKGIKGLNYPSVERPTTTQPQEIIIQPAKSQKIPAPPLSAYPNKNYDLVFFYADGKSTKFQAPANYTDITLMIDGGDVVPLGNAKTNRCGDIFAFLYDQSNGLLTACKSYKSGTNILFRGVSTAEIKSASPTEQDVINAKLELGNSQYFQDFIIDDDSDTLILNENFLSVITETSWRNRIKDYCIGSTKSSSVPYPVAKQIIRTTKQEIMTCKSGQIISNPLSL